jgi:two-component system LytT family response regulator
MTLTCYIIDDEPHAIESITKHIQKTPGLELMGTAVNPLVGIEAISDSPTDLVFLDIDMPQLNGLSVADLIGPLTNIIFTTAFKEYAVEAFEKHAEDYLMKPITYERFLKCITRLRTKNTGTAPEPDYQPFFFVKSGIKGKLNRVTVDEIQYIENIGNYVYIHTVKEKITAYLTLAEALTKLPKQQFSRIHQSFIINLAYIDSVEYGQVRLNLPVTLPIGGTYRASFKAKIQENTLISKREQHPE